MICYIYRQECFSVKLTTRKVHTKLHLGLTSVFFISSLERILMTSFPGLILLFVCLYNKKNITWRLEDMNLFSCAKKQ